MLFPNGMYPVNQICKHNEIAWFNTVLYRMPMAQEEAKREDVLSLMPYIRRDAEIDFNPEMREKIRKTEMERQKRKKI